MQTNAVHEYVIPKTAAMTIEMEMKKAFHIFMNCNEFLMIEWNSRLRYAEQAGQALDIDVERQLFHK